MPAHLVTYRLNRDEQNYPGLYEYFAKLPYAVVGTSSRVILTDKPAHVIAEELGKHIDANDRLFVFNLSGHWSGFGGKDGKEIVDWLKLHIMP